ncbi:MAG: FHA domain-containing protein [Bdellovibrionales bacterium]|nr:FHA domain-containing protein [Bdellovibrionales bacterium]
MWSLRVLNGPQAGQLFNLKSGRNVVGRSSQCDIKLMAPGVSKEHCEVYLNKEKILIVDLNSSNGTYVNGTRVQKTELRFGEKFSLHNIFLDIVPTPQLRTSTVANNFVPNINHGNAAPNPMYQQQPLGVAGAHPGVNSIPQPHLNLVNGQKVVPEEDKKPDLKERVEEYFNKVVLPSVYKLAQMFEFKYVLAGFVGIFIFVVTLLSLFPMISVTRDSIQGEARKRTMSLARALAETNKKAIDENSGASLNTYSIEREEGVKEALIINRNDGTVMAPATKSGRTLDIPFINEAIRSGRELVKSVDYTTIAAAYPINKYDLDRQEAVPIAYAIVIYDISTLAFDQGVIISLFMQNLIIAMLIGSLLYFFLYKLIEFPVASLNKQLDLAMREKNEHIENTFLFPPLQALAGNVSSLMTRYLHGDHKETATLKNKDFEASMLIQHFRDPAFAISPNRKILNLNSNFESLAQNSMDNLMMQGLDAIVDSSLKLNIENLMEQASQMPNQIHQEELDMGRGSILIRCHAVIENDQPSYYLFSIIPTKEGDG